MNKDKLIKYLNDCINQYYNIILNFYSEDKEMKYYYIGCLDNCCAIIEILNESEN